MCAAVRNTQACECTVSVESTALTVFVLDDTGGLPNGAAGYDFFPISMASE